MFLVEIINFIDTNWELSNGFWVIFVIINLFFKLYNVYYLRLLEIIKINVTFRLGTIVIFIFNYYLSGCLYKFINFIIVLKIGLTITNTNALYNYTWIDGTAFNANNLQYKKYIVSVY